MMFGSDLGLKVVEAGREESERKTILLSSPSSTPMLLSHSFTRQEIPEFGLAVRDQKLK